MSPSPSAIGAGFDRQRFTLYAAGGHIYAQNALSTLIELGTIDRTAAGFAYRLDGDESLHAKGFAGADDVLRDVAGRIGFVFLDGQFTSLPDRAEDYDLNLAGASHLALVLETFSDEDDESPLALRTLGGGLDSARAGVPPSP